MVYDRSWLGDGLSIYIFSNCSVYITEINKFLVTSRKKYLNLQKDFEDKECKNYFPTG